MRKIAAIVMIMMFVGNLAWAQKASVQSIQQMMQRTGAAKIGMQMMQQMLPSLQKMLPNAPKSFWSDFMSEVDPNEIVELLIPIYQKHLTQADVDGINAFYATSAGQKLIAVQPNIVRESYAVGQQWGRSIAQKVIQKYKAEQTK